MLKRSAEDAWKAFSKVTPGFLDFRDASYAPHCTYKCTVSLFNYESIKFTDPALFVGARICYSFEMV